MERNRIQQQFPTLYPLCVALYQCLKTVSRIALRAGQRIWRPVLSLCMVLAALHLIALVVTGLILKEEIRRIPKQSELVAQTPVEVPQERNAAVEYRRATELLTPIENKRGFVPAVRYSLIDDHREPLSSADWQTAIKEAKQYDTVLALAATAATKPECSFPLSKQRESGRVFLELRMLSDLLFGAAVVRAHQQDAEESTRAFLAACKTASFERTYSAFYSTPLGSASRAYHVVQRIASLTELTGEQLERMRLALSELEDSGFVDKAVIEEQVRLVENYDEARRYGIPGLFVDYCYYEEGERPFLSERVTGWLQTPYINFNEIVALRDFQRNQGNARLHTHELAKKGISPGLSSCSESIPKYAYIARIGLSINAAAIALDHDRLETANRGNSIFLALLHHKSRFGSFPKNMAELKQHCLWQTEPDPFSGKDFVYKRTKTGFVLYSIGWDLKDDGARRRKNGYYWDEADIAWRYPIKQIGGPDRIRTKPVPLPPMPV